MYFGNYRLWKTSSDFSLKSTVSEHALTINMWKCLEYLQNVHWEQFYHVFHHSEWSWFRKRLPYIYVKSYWCFLTQWLPRPSILLNIRRICHSELKWNYLKNEKLFLDFLFRFWNLHQVLNKKTMVVIADVFPKLQTVNKFVRRLYENPRFGICFDSQHVKVSQILAKCPFLVILSCFFIFLMEVDLENVSPSVS